MKLKALSVKECTWTSEECHFSDDGNSQSNSLCLPNIFRPKRVKPLNRSQNGPTYQVYYTARELLVEVLDRGAIRELTRRVTSAKSGSNRTSYTQTKELNADLSEGEYADALTWFSVVLQSGISVGEKCTFSSELTLDGWQGVLKRNSFQTNLMSLTRLEDVAKFEVLSAFCSHLTRRYQALYTPGHNLAIKKYHLFYQEDPCSLDLALLCDISTGFICNMFLFCPEQLQKQSRKPVVEQVISHLLRPFCSSRHLIRVNSSAWMDGKLTGIFSNFGVNIHFVPAAKTPLDLTSPKKLQNQDSTMATHLQGWTGPALFRLSDLKGSGVDVFLPGLWVVLHVVCINTFVLHTLQNQGSGRNVDLSDFTKSLASQLAVDPSVSVPVLPRLHSSYQEAPVANTNTQGTNETSSSSPQMKNEKQSRSREPSLNIQSRPGVCGLDNSGNSCYFNAVFQCLCSTVPLVEHLLHHDTRREITRSKCRVAGMFVRLLEQMWLGRSSSCAPVEARSVLCSILPQFNNYCQQDAQELLLYFINALHDDLKKVARRQDQKKNIPRSDSTVVSRLFEGRLSGVTLCLHCDHQAHSTQPFTILSLPIPADLISCSIQDCLSLFFEHSVLTGGEQMLCSVCGLRRETAVVTYLDKPPEILMLHLKRFGCKGKSQVKLRTNVVFSTEKLDLSPFLSSSVNSGPYSSYSLYAVVNHIGHLNMGHYTALCYNTVSQTWHCFDDSVVRPIQDVLVQSPHAYLLLYSRKPFQKPLIHGL